LLRLNSSGKVKWHHTYGDWYDETFFGVEQTADGGFVAAGGTNSFGANSDDWDLLLLKLSRRGVLGVESEFVGDADTRVRSTHYRSANTEVTPVITRVTPQRTTARSPRSNAPANVLVMESQLLPAAPTDLRVQAFSGSEIRLQWTDASSIEKGFRIERRRSAGGQWEEIGTVRRNKKRYRDTGLPAGTPYEYRVRAFNRDGFSTYSNVAQVGTS
jgi:hypothetical protein